MNIINISMNPLSVKTELLMRCKKRMIIWFSLSLIIAMVGQYSDIYLLNIAIGVCLFLGGEAWRQSRIIKSDTLFLNTDIDNSDVRQSIETDLINIKFNMDFDKSTYITLVYPTKKNKENQ